MRSHLVQTVSVALLLGLPAAALPQQQSGNLYGTVTDTQGEPLPGARVELTGLGGPQTQFTDAQGQFRFLGLEPGNRHLTASLEGFSTVDYPKIDIRVGRNTTLEVTLSPAVEEVITVTSESPLLDERKVARGTTISQIELEKIPTARDPWAVLQETPGVLVDRINVGGNESGQQAVFTGPATLGDENVFTVDGVVITDQAAIGAFPSYFDFDAFEEFVVSTGGTDVSPPTPGAVLNVVTRRGSNNPRGSARYLLSEDTGGFFDFVDPAERFGSVPNLQIEVGHDPGSSACLDGFQFYDLSGKPLAGFDLPDGSTVGLALDPPLWFSGPVGGSEVPIDADGDGVTDFSLRFVPPCRDGDPALGFVDLDPYAFPTHLAIGGSTFLPLDLSRLPARIATGGGVGQRTETTWIQEDGPTDIHKLEDTHVFSSDFYLTGIYSYVDGGFAVVPGSSGEDPSTSDGIFVLGFDRDRLDETTREAIDLRLEKDMRFTDNLSGILSLDAFNVTNEIWRNRNRTNFFELGGLPSPCPGVVGGFYRVEETGEGGGRLTPAPDAPEIDCAYLQDRVRLNDYFTLNLGVRADAFDPRLGVHVSPEEFAILGESDAPDRGSLFRPNPFRDGFTWIRHDGFGATPFGGPLVGDKLWIWGSYGEADVTYEDQDPGDVATGVPSHWLFGVDGVGPIGLEDADDFSRSFYVSGLHSVVDGGSRVDPTETSPPRTNPFSPDDGIFFFSYAGDRTLPGGASGSLPDVDGDGIGDTFLIDPSELRTLCPDVIGGFFRFGPDDTLIPDDTVQVECPRDRDGTYFFNTGSANHELRFGGIYRSDRQLDFSFSDMVAPRVGFTWDVAQGGRSKLYGHYGRFYESVPLDLGENRTWGWGFYDQTTDRRDPTELRTGTYTGILTPNFFTEGQYSERDFTLGGVGSAPLASGIQDGGIEFWSKWSEGAPCGGRCRPGGAYEENGSEPAVAPPAGDDDLPLVHIVARGGSTGEVYDVTIVHPASGPVPLEGLVAIEPVAATAADRARFEREIEAAGGVVETVTGAGYCLQFAAKAPPQGTVFRLAPAEKQRAFEPASRALAAARRLHEAGRFSPDTDPESYYHAIRQWAVWTLEQGFDRDGFVDAFLDHTRRNVEERGQRWTSEIADIVRRSAEGRWSDVSQVLREAQASSGS